MVRLPRRPCVTPRKDSAGAQSVFVPLGMACATRSATLVVPTGKRRGNLPEIIPFTKDVSINQKEITIPVFKYKKIIKYHNYLSYILLQA